MNFSEYNFEEHLHRYAVWTAARAQRAFATTAVIKEAIDKANLKEKAFNLSAECSNEEFDHWHSDTCNELKGILQVLKKEGKFKGDADIEFGRAAKILNIYLKTTLVVPNCYKDTALVSNIHPPIDAILLKALITGGKLDKERNSVRWTTMAEETYLEIIKQIRSFCPVLWKVEFYWKPEKEKNQNTSQANATTGL